MKDYMVPVDAPELSTWEPSGEEQIYYSYEHEVVRAHYEEKMNLNRGLSFSTFIILRPHFKNKIEDIIKHINYFLDYYDKDKDIFVSVMSIKFQIDQYPSMSKDVFSELIMTRIITPEFIERIKMMAWNLYKININSDSENRYRNTPKITNEQARQLIAISFAIRMILPLCIHFVNTNKNFIEKTSYIPCFDRIFMKLIKGFEVDDIEVLSDLIRFTDFRVNRAYNSNRGVWQQKKQLHGDVKSLYVEEVIHEVIIVKGLYKLDYTKSPVSFLDGIISKHHSNFQMEKFKSKPVEIDSDESTSDNDDYLSRSESLEMAVYRVDESNVMINDVNIECTMAKIKMDYNIRIPPEEFRFYYENCTINSITQFLLHGFYSKKFNDTNAIYNLNREETITLMLIMKKYFQLCHMIILPQICTAKVRGKFKDSAIKNSKFIEKITSSSVYQNIISVKYKYVDELNPKENLIIKRLSTIINSTFEFVDFDDRINEMEYADVDIDQISNEFLYFLSLI